MRTLEGQEHDLVTLKIIECRARDKEGVLECKNNQCNTKVYFFLIVVAHFFPLKLELRNHLRLNLLQPSLMPLSFI